MSIRSDAETSLGRLDLPEVRAESRLRGLFVEIDRARPMAVTTDPAGALVGALSFGSAVFLPETNPADMRPPRDRIGAALRGVVSGLLVLMLIGAVLSLYYNFAFWPLALLAWGALGLRRIDVRLRVPRALPRPGNPGVLLLPDLLVIRRDGVCQVFPRMAITGISEVQRTRARGTGEAPVQYAITEITFQGLHGGTRYTLDVGPPASAPDEPALVAAEQVRSARLRRLQAWLQA